VNRTGRSLAEDGVVEVAEVSGRSTSNRSSSPVLRAVSAAWAGWSNSAHPGDSSLCALCSVS
jgi:hypothetical protein